MFRKKTQRIAECLVLIAIILCFTGSDKSFACEKKGVGLVQMSFMKVPDFVKVINAHWYYDWTPSPPLRGVPAPFVPMVNGRSFRLQDDLQIVTQKPVPILLGFNEPDIEPTSLTVDEAIAIWPKLQGSAVRLGSPAPSSLGLNWLQRFMMEAREKHLKVDFIAVHYYGPPDAEGFLQEIDHLHDLYGLPIWITEFAVRERVRDPQPYTPGQVLDFLHVVIPELERRSYVERFAWWGVGGARSDLLKSSRFFNDDGSLTDVGRYYASVEANDNGPLCGLP